MNTNNNESYQISIENSNFNVNKSQFDFIKLIIENPLIVNRRYPTAFQTVDIAIVNDNSQVLLAQKPNTKLWRFVGGFSDPASFSLEQDAKRESIEETGLEVDYFTYLGSALINDPRYFNTVDKIKTAFFVAKYIFGKPVASDDIVNLKWVNFNNINKDEIEPLHHILIDMFINNFLHNHTLLRQYISSELSRDFFYERTS